MKQQLKIRDDVHLNDLEKLGFKWSFNNGSYDFLYKPRKNTDIPLIVIDVKTRIIIIQGVCDMHNTVENTLYDLFEASLIERVLK